MKPEEFQAIIQRARELQAASAQPDAQAVAAAQQFAAHRQQQAQQLAQQQAIEAQRQQAAMAEAQRQYTMNRNRTAGELAGDVGLALAQTVVRGGQAAYGMANMTTLGFLDRAAQATGYGPDFQRTQQYLDSLKSEPLQMRKAATDAAFDEGLLAGAGALVSMPTVLADYGLQSSVYLLPGFAIPRAAGAAAGVRAAAAGLTEAQTLAAAAQAATRANYATQAGLGAGMMNVDAINAAREGGATEGEQQAIGLGAGLAAGVALPLISRLTGAAGLEARAAQAIGGGAVAAGRGARLGAIGAGTLREGVEEAGQSAAEQAIQNVAGSRPVLEDVGKAAVVGGLTAAPLGAAMGAVTPVAGQQEAAAKAPPMGEGTTVTLGAPDPDAEAQLLAAGYTKVSPTEFRKPAGYTKVSPTEFRKPAGAGAGHAAHAPQEPLRIGYEAPATLDAVRQPSAASRGVQQLTSEVAADLSQVVGHDVLRPSPLATGPQVPIAPQDRTFDLFGRLQDTPTYAQDTATVPAEPLPVVSRRQLGLDLSPDTEALLVTPDGQAFAPQYDLFGHLADMRTPQEPEQAAAVAQAVSRRQMGLDLQQDAGAMYVGQDGQATDRLLPAFAREQRTTPPVLDQAALLRAGVLPPAFSGAVPAPAMPDVRASLGTPAEHRRALRDAVMKKAKLSSSQIGGANVKALLDDMVRLGMDHRDPQFGDQVGRMANERLMAVDAEGKASQPLLNIARAFGGVAAAEDAANTPAVGPRPTAPVGKPERKYHVAVVNDRTGYKERLSLGEPMTHASAMKFKARFTEHKDTRLLLEDVTHEVVAAQAEAPQQYMAAVNALTAAQSAAEVDTVVSTIRSAPEFAALPLAERIAMEGQIASAIERTTGAKFTLAESVLMGHSAQQENLDPDPAEATAVAAALSGKSAVQAAEWLSKNGSTASRLVAAKVAQQLKKLESLGARFTFAVTPEGRQIAYRVRGIASSDILKDGTIKVDILLNGPHVTGYVGSSYKTAVHELVHAATMVSIQLGDRRAAEGTQLAKDVGALYDVFNHAVRHFNSNVKAGSMSTFETAMYNRLNNAMADPKEMVAWALTDADMQTWLDSIPYSGGSVWTAFVTAVRRLLGLPAQADTALSEVLRVSDAIMSNTADVEYALGRLTGRITGATAMINTQEGPTGGAIAVDGVQRPRANSNGQPIAGTDEALRSFWRWFGDSKVVDAQGRPKVVHHGTTATKTRVVREQTDAPAGVANARETLMTLSARINGSRGDWKSASRILDRLESLGRLQEYGFTEQDAADARAALAGASVDTQYGVTERGVQELAFSKFRMPKDSELGVHVGTEAQAALFGDTFQMYVAVQNPLRLPDLGNWTAARVIAAMREAGVAVSEAEAAKVSKAADTMRASRTLLKKKGYDGVVYWNEAEGFADSYIVLDGAGIKSATDNTGTFDPANPDIRYRQGGQRTAIAEAVRAASGRLAAEGVTIHDTVADLRRAVGFQPPSTTKGVYVNGQTHVVLENIADPTDLALTVAHERGHAGLDQLLGQSLRAATNRMWASTGLRRSIKTKMAETGYGRALAAEEVLADMLASGQRLPNDVLAKLYTGVRNFIARLFGTKLTIANQQINDLLEDVARVMRGAPAGSVRADMRNPELWFTDPAVAASQNPKFSKVKEDTIDAIIRSAANEGKTTPFNELVQAVARATVDTAKNVADWLGSGGVSGILVRNSLPLNQIANLHDRLFGGRIGALSRLKTAKDARFNSLNAREQEWAYGEQHLAKKSVNDVGKEWMEYARKHPAKKQLLDRVLSDGSFYKVFPDRRELTNIDYDTVGYTQAEREAAAADIWKAWDALDAQGKNLYRYSQAMYAARWNQEYAAKQQELTRIGQALEGVDAAASGRINRLKAELATAKGKMTEGPYSPLQRNGDYLVEARDADGKVLHFSAHDSRREALAAQAALRADLEAQGVTGATVGVDEKGQYQWRIDNVSLAKMDQIHRDVAAAIPAGASEEQRQQIINALSGSLVELYLQSLPQASFGNHAKNRKHVSGYDRDALRAFGAYAMKSARAIANTEYDGRINTAINEIGQFIEDTRKGTDLTPEQRAAGVTETDVGKLRQVFEGVRAQHAASLNTDRSKIGDALTQGSYIWFMTSPSQMFMNASQTWMVAFPRLAAKYGAGNAIKEINKAAGQYFTGGRDLIGDRSALTTSNDPKQQIAADVLNLLRERGPLDIGQVHDLAGVADGSAGELSPYWGRAMDVMSYAMHHSEVFNRQVTAAANVALELRGRSDLPQRGTPEYAALIEALYDKAFQTIDSTQFNYSASNKPPVMQGPMGRLVFQFQMYRFHMLAMIGKDIRDAELGRAVRGLKPMNAAEAKEARAALSWLLAMQLGFTGTAGTVLAPFVFALADAFRDEDDLTDSRTDWINYAGKYVAHGVAAGVLDTSRIASDSLIPYFGDRGYIDPNATNSEALQAYAIKYLGPWVGFLSDIGTGVGALADIADIDQYQTRKELWKALPKPLEDAAKAVDEGFNGVQDKTGVVYQQPSLFGSVSQFFGLRTAERRDVEQQRGAYYGAMSRIYDRQTRILGRLANAYATNDMAGVNEAMADITAWNQRYPDTAILQRDVHRAIRTRIVKQEVADQTGVPMGRLPGPTTEAVLGR